MTGTLGGSAFVVKDAISIVGPSEQGAQVVLSSTPNLCSDVGNHVQRANARVVLIDVSDNSGAKLADATYMTSYSDPVPARSAVFESNITDAQCNVSYDPPPDGTGDGTVTLTSVSASTVSGTFDVVMENGEHVTGTFEPSACPALAMSGGTPACTP